MKIHELHGWKLSTEEAREIQKKLASRVIYEYSRIKPKLIAGVDVSVSRFSRHGRAAVALLTYPSMELVDVKAAEGEILFPYIPGLLSFREAPLVLQAFSKLKYPPDMVLVDGQGIAHPRRLGLASHLGLFLNLPTIGCAKSRLIGTHDEVPLKAKTYSYLIDNSEIIGAVVRTRQDVKPLYISIGHKVDLSSAISYVIRCCRGFRLPEPTRLAHLAANDRLSNFSVKI
ncbi:MAG: deoxyribonuclease V [Chloroflexi bacterium]|nr:deoxyribonuclease V [Chloroflexota bacterium]